MRFVVLGKDGMLGSYVYRYLKNNNNTVGVGKEFRVTKKYENNVSFLRELIQREDIVINCVGAIPQKTSDLQTMIMLNSQFPLLLSVICNEKGAFLIQPSTDCVFDGKVGNYTSTDIPNEISSYGITKIMGEIDCPNTMIIRSSIIGEDDADVSLLGWLKTNKHKRISGYTNHLWNGLTSLQYAKEIEKIVQRNGLKSGILHLCSPDSCSKYELLKILNNVYKLNVDIVPQCHEKSVNRILHGKIVDISLEQQIREMYAFKIYRKNIFCRLCQGSLKKIMDLGSIAIAGAFHHSLIFGDETNELYPFTLGFCVNCSLILCQEIINPDILFKTGYFYRSSQIPFLVRHFSEYATILKQQHGSDNKILEIGCNDGVFLRQLKNQGFSVVGVDPASNLTVNLVTEGYRIYSDYVEDCVDLIKKEQGVFDIIVASNCMAHTPNIKETFSAIKSLLKEGGNLYIEVHYGGSVFNENQFDFLYHEHMTYYTVTSMFNIARYFNMSLHEVIFTKVHGKSMRIQMMNCVKDMTSEIQELLHQETNLSSLSFLSKKEQDISAYKTDLKRLFDTYSPSEYIRYAYGASGRANTICSYCNLSFDFFVDDAPSKIGGFTPFFNVPIVNSKYLYEFCEKKRVLWILAWPYAKEILEQHSRFDGIIIVPDLPNLSYTIIENNDSRKR